MAWIESHQSLADHRKTKDLKRILNIKTPQAIGHLHLLWWWALDNAPDGNLSAINSKDIAEVAEWTGNADKFLGALKTSGFVDDDLYLHDWDEYAGKLIAKRKANTERVKRHRNALRNANVSITSPLRNGATVPNSTVPNSTVPSLSSLHDDDNLQKGLNVFKAYAENIGELTSHISDELKAAEVEFGAERVVEAIKTAAEHNARSWKYIAACLENERSETQTTLQEFNGNSDPDAAVLWQKALKELKVATSAPNYHTWLEKTCGLALTDDEFILGVPNGFVADYLDKNQRSLIERTLINLTQRDQLTVSFRLCPVRAEVEARRCKGEWLQ